MISDIIITCGKWQVVAKINYQTGKWFALRAVSLSAGIKIQYK